jgi:tetratricopeptide (TPR) repeat protein
VKLVSFLLAAVQGLGAVEVAPASEKRGVVFLEQRLKEDPDDFIAANQLGERYLQILRSTGEDRYLTLAKNAAEASLRSVPAEANAGGLALRARVALAGHRFANARDDARKLAELQPGKIAPRLILGDALLELGEYGEAAALFEKLRAEDAAAVDIESRSARLALVQGRVDDARAHFNAGLEAARELGIPSPETVAWYCLQLGGLEFRGGNWGEAEKWYNEALKTHPNDSVARDYIAELRGAEKKFHLAISTYRELIAASPRPHLMQALGDIFALDGKADEARAWHEKALAAYMASVDRGEVHYFHHLAGFFADSMPDPAKAVEWAKKDLELRQSIHAWDALAWAQYKAGQLDEAKTAIERALATGTKDAHILHHAGMIFMSAGDLARGKAELQRAAASNPRYHSFHVHR